MTTGRVWVLTAGLLAAGAFAGVLGGARADGEDDARVPDTEVERAFETIRRAVGLRPAEAEPTPAGAPRTRLADEELLTVLKGYDPKASVDRPGRLMCTLHEQTILVGNEGEAGIRLVHILQGIKPNPTFQNGWNNQRRFASVSVDEDGDWWFEQDIPLWGGVTTTYVSECIDLFQELLAIYLEEVSALLPPADGN
ncbi:MAG: YbjN domain-containing protein [Planctomycetes bacterium]|nr:YbjN domain-containing protein [Planctomycetota bacterium]MCB9824568.1 YbjN domain-containing protein [Planctomycetota bacterium]MCB9829678.1 YbjN domain-containing protein [Planctomycetota bacterium]MCB9900020.1 YbjN domain-containing protein [Planctomycetota bacterium]